MPGFEPQQLIATVNDRFDFEGQLIGRSVIRIYY